MLNNSEQKIIPTNLSALVPPVSLSEMIVYERLFSIQRQIADSITGRVSNGELKAILEP